MSGDDLAAVVDLGVIKRTGVKDALIDHAPSKRDLLLKFPDHVPGGIADPVEPVDAPEHGLVAEQATAATYPQNIAVGARCPDRQDIDKSLRARCPDIPHVAVGKLGGDWADARAMMREVTEPWDYMDKILYYSCPDSERPVVFKVDRVEVAKGEYPPPYPNP